MTNLVILIGNLGDDPIVRNTARGGKVAQMSLATSTRWTDKTTGERKEQTEWHRISAFNGLADIVAKYPKKGSKVSIQGRLHYSSWTDGDGAKKYGVEIIADNIELLDKAPANTRRDDCRQDEPARTPAMAGGYDDLDDDVPF